MTLTPVKSMIQEARESIKNLAPEEVAARKRDPNVVLVDLREPGELTQQGKIPGAITIPRGMLEFCADPSTPYHTKELAPERPIVLYCASGGRSALAAAALKGMGYEDVAHLDGGFKAWREKDLPVES